MNMDLERFQHFVQLRESGHTEDALDELASLRARTSDPEETASLWLNTAACHQGLGRLGEAWEALSEARRSPTSRGISLHADFLEATLYWDEGRYQQAQQRLEMLAKAYAQELRAPDERNLYEKVQVKRGILLSQMQRDQEAVPILEEALSFALEDTDRGDVSANLGICYFSRGDKRRARDLFRVAAQYASPSYETVSHYYLGIIESQDGAYAQALQEFLAVEPNAPNAGISRSNVYSCLARVSRALGHVKEAERYDKLAGR